MTGLRRGDWVEVRTAAEITTTLDARGALEGLPFMAEMHRFCGRRYRVSGRAGRICTETAWMRRMDRAVLLEDVRCDGSGHGGCQRACLIFWKEAWLKPIPAPPPGPAARTPHECGARSASEVDMAGRKPVFVCQATEIVRATTPYRSWDPRQHLTDVLSGNISVGAFLRRTVRQVRNRVARLQGARPGGAAAGTTPAGTLALQPGELVEVRSRQEILATLDAQGRNRGMAIEDAMLDLGGCRFRVSHRIDRIILEGSGEMRPLRDTVALERVTCPGCPKKNVLYWREIWLRRVEE